VGTREGNRLRANAYGQKKEKVRFNYYEREEEGQVQRTEGED